MGSVSGVITNGGDFVDGVVSEGAATGGPLPMPVLVRMLVDTGAQTSTADPWVVGALGLIPAGVVAVSGATGFTVFASTYNAHLFFPHPSGDPALGYEVPNLMIIELPQSHDEHDTMVGRDVLNRLILTRDGPAGTFLLVF